MEILNHVLLVYMTEISYEVLSYQRRADVISHSKMKWHSVGLDSMPYVPCFICHMILKYDTGSRSV